MRSGWEVAWLEKRTQDQAEKLSDLLHRLGRGSGVNKVAEKLGKCCITKARRRECFKKELVVGGVRCSWAVVEDEDGGVAVRFWDTELLVTLAGGFRGVVGMKARPEWFEE